MIIQLEQNITADQRSDIQSFLNQLDIQNRVVQTQYGEYWVGIPKNDFDIRAVGHLNGVRDIHRVDDAYKLVSKQWKVGRTAVEILPGVKIGNGYKQLISGPCSIESEDQIIKTATYLKQAGIRLMRGGVFKPRSSPYSFRGLGMDGLKMWHDITQDYQLGIVTEVMEVDKIEKMYPYVDVYQVGARNSQNFNLLDALGEVDKPILLKRGISGTINELLQSAEYIFSKGNERIMLCERGIRTFETASRNTFDINAIPILQEKTHLPVVADPSHGIGIRKHVKAISAAAIAAGADGLIVESHPVPQKAFSDAAQTVSFEVLGQIAALMK